MWSVSRPGTVQLSSMANPITAEGAYFNALCNLDENNLALDPLTAQVEEGPAVKIYKA